MLKRDYIGTCHRLSTKHLQRYANEFARRHSIRDVDTADMTTILVGMFRKRLLYSGLTANNVLASGT